MKQLFILISLLLFFELSFGQDTGSFTDKRDGKTYKTIKIGEQVWMTENLAYLPKVYPPLEISSKKTRYYVFHYEGYDVEEAKNTEFYEKFGVLYNYKAAEKGCPDGWHLPTDKDWTILELLISNKKQADSLDYSTRSSEGKDLKATYSWLEDGNGDGNGTDKFGFTGLAAGANWGGDYDYLGYMTKMWTAFDKKSEHDFYFYRQLSSASEELVRFDTPSDFGFSVRCIKD